MEKRKQLIFRFVISIMAGLIVTSLAIIIAWRNFGLANGLRLEQWRTQMNLVIITEAIPAYQERTGMLPNTLDDLRILDKSELLWLTFHEEQGLLDGWERPFEYTTDGINYTVTSFGRDGKPGGVGPDCDLTNIEPKPASAFPTFAQFLFDLPTEGMVGVCVMSGLLVFFLIWSLLKPIQLTRKKLLALCIKIMVTIVGTIIVAFFIALLHVPTGH